MSLIRRADRLAQEHTEEAITKLVDIMRHGDNSDALKASNSLLDRGHGKAVTAIISLPQAQEQRRMLAAMSDEDLDNALIAYEIPRALPPAKDPLLE